MLALRDDMDTAMTIVYQSSIQIALFATPFLVLLSWGFVAVGIQKGQPMSMVFTPMEVAAVVLTILIVAMLLGNGETNWFEGMLLLGMYGVLAIGFFYIPGGHEGAVQSSGATTAPSTHP
jgi:Ca2+:H+ antiporter